MNKDRFAPGRFGALWNKAAVQQRFFIFHRQRQVIHPLEKIGAGLIAHPHGQVPGESVAFEKEVEFLPQEIFRVERQRPIKAVIHKNWINVAEPERRRKFQVATGSDQTSQNLSDPTNNLTKPQSKKK
jgi:hypothetical protein